jgi:hypothetical protein
MPTLIGKLFAPFKSKVRPNHKKALTYLWSYMHQISNREIKAGGLRHYGELKIAMMKL